ncbi:hypothetical protein ABGB00_01615 [Staphylococcus saprophyticus]
MINVILNSYPKALVNFNSWIKAIESDYIIIVPEKKASQFDECNIKTVSNYSDDNEVLKALKEINEISTITKIITLRESDLMRASKFRKIFGLEGQSLESSINFTNKLSMKQLMLKNNVPAPEFYEVSDFYKFCNDSNHYLVKPITGTSSEGIVNIYSEEDLKKLDNISDYYIEKYTNFKNMYSIDGICINNEIKFLSAHEYGIAPLEFIGGKNWNIIKQVSECDPIFKKLFEFQENIVTILQNENNVYCFHTEVFLKSDNSLDFCETTCRLGGAMIPEMIKQSYGIDLEYLQIKGNIDGVQSILPYLENLEQKNEQYTILIPKEIGVLKSFLTKDLFDYDWVIDFASFVEIGNSYSGSKHAIDVSCHITLNISDNSFQSKLSFIQKLYEKNVLYI